MGAPNIVLILLDDVGMDQLAFYDDQNAYPASDRYPYAHTPHLAALAAAGVRFDQCRAMPVCSPTRASLLSGAYPFRHGTGTLVRTVTTSPTFREFGVPPAPTFPTLPAVLSAAGYATAVIGKWHLGLEPEAGGTLDGHPVDLGFGSWEGPPRNLAAAPSPPVAPGGVGAGYYNYWWIESGARSPVVGIYNTIYTRQRAQSWMLSAPEPFFLYLPFNAVHEPLNGDNWPARGPNGPPQHGFSDTAPRDAHPDQTLSNTRFRATLETFDTQLGLLLEALGPRRDRTLFLVMGDNGTPGQVFVPPASGGEFAYPLGHPLHQPGDESREYRRGPYDVQRVKGSIYEGGVRVPLVASGAGVVGPGRTTDALVDAVDLFPTIAGVAGAPLPPGAAPDGVDFGELLFAPGAPGDRSFGFTERFSPNGLEPLATQEFVCRGYVRRDGQDLWKLVHLTEDPVGDPLGRYEFYRLRGPNNLDPLERTDLGTGHPAFAPTLADYQALLSS